ncbi:hypothetical protein P9302_16050 [Brevibacillus agri]|uniref:hypothetical protein n=1 Tax=Brevibacillus agri TaxID=51101 RepID=UPI002E1B5C16|nr:hypothetical protein [Brevibacillus agri]
MRLSIIPNSDPVKDPRTLLYFYPKMPAVRFAQMVSEYHNDDKLRMAESIAHSLGAYLVPSSCLHWRFKQQHADRKVQVGYQTYYSLRREEMTDGAFQKFVDHVHKRKPVILPG